jgi:hypothetical protein
MKLLKKI